MDENKRFILPMPIVDEQEIALLDALTERYEKLIAPSAIAALGAKVGELIPSGIKSLGAGIASNLSEQELYQQIMNLLATGFKAIEAEAAKYSISEKAIVSKVNTVISDCDIVELSEVCLARSYSLSKLVNANKRQDILAAFIGGGATGAFGFFGLPFNIVLSTFLYFRAVQSIAMFYGYDVKNDDAELVIASEVFTNALGPVQSDESSAATSIIGKVMLMSQAEVVKKAAKKSWSEMIARGGIPLLLAQMRALANKAAQNALEKAGAKGLENSLFKEAFEQIGRKLTLKAVGKAVPLVSAAFGALVDTAQMQRVFNYADIFYHKRYILEKENRVRTIVSNQEIIIDAEILYEENS